MSFDAFCDQHRADLTRLARRQTGNPDDADDVVGAALASAWENWGRVGAAQVPVAYVRRMVVNLAADQVGRIVRERRQTRSLAHLSSESYENPDVVTELDLRAALGQLPPGQRSCVALRHLFGFSPEEVSRELGISQGTVKSQTSRGLLQLRETLRLRSFTAG